jgi:hypothetical protein
MIVLKPGMEGNRTLGTHAIPGIYVKFSMGMVDVKEDSVIALLRAHSGYGIDFIEVKENEIDPYSDTREEVEPTHFISEVKYGHVEKAAGSPRPTKLTPAMKRLIEGEALKMLPGLLKANPKILKDIIMSLASEMKEPKVTETELPAKEIEEKEVKAK